MSPTVPNNIGADKRPVSSGRPSTGERRWAKFKILSKRTIHIISYVNVDISVVQ